MANCPVCNQEYTEGTVEFCPRCYYLLTTYSPNLFIHPEVQERERKRLHSAKEAWKKFSHTYSELKQQLQTAKKGNQNAPNDSLLEQHLQNISSNIQSLPEMLNLLQQINKHLSDQSHNFNKLFQSQQLAVQENLSSNEIKSENEISEPEDLSNTNEHNIIHDAEVYDLVENYNQHADFPDKIEVSETEHSKSRRWGGSQEPAVFEPNHKGRGDYWIINNQYLVPKPKQKINEHSYKTISILFECFNYEQNATDNMTLIKPAKVSSINGEEKWRLEEMGTLEF
ncbi:MAG: hypothetical protein VKL60_04360 [Sphaerospermopsis sp.]|nr:hypothetical protein [Sphaerospermopsis sp.]